MENQENKYPKEFHQWVTINGYSFIEGKWWLWPDGEKQEIWICDTTDELYEIFKKEKMETLTKSQRAEFDNIAKNQPVFSGKLQSHQDAQELMNKGLAMRYDGDYVLTEKGKELKSDLEGAAMIAKKSEVNQWAIH